MSKFGSTRELHARIGASIDKLSSTKLEIQEFEVLLDEARELYERLLILRFKAFENHVSGKPLPVAIEVEESPTDRLEVVQEISDTSSQIEEPVKHVPHDAEQLIVDNNEPSIEFALFGETTIEEAPSLSTEKLVEKNHEEPASQEIVIPEVPTEEVVTPVVVQSRPELSVTTTRVEVRVEEHKIQGGGSLLDQLSTGSQSNRLADQLKKSRIESIASTLTLNDRIRFSKNLFGGNSETFNAAVQLFDAQKSMMEAMELLRDYSERFHWDQDDKTTMDFYELVERRHA